MTSGRRRAGRLVVWGVVAVAVVAGAAISAAAVQERSEVDAASHRQAHRAVADLRAVQADREDVADQEADAAASADAQRIDDLATVEIITSLDELQTLQDRIALAEGELARARQVSAEQVARLDVLKGCVGNLELARSAYVGGDQAGATAALAAGADICNQAEAITGGSGAAHPFDFPDPFVLREGDGYYAFGTNGPAGTIQVVSSTNLGDWQVRGAALEGVPSWAVSGFTWAPSAIKTTAGFTMFYTVKHRFSGKQCISRAVSPNPEGPYVDSSTEPLICQLDEGGSIDPSPYVDDAGGLHLTWKAEGETIGLGASIWTVALQPDGAKVAWFPTKLFAVDRGWEGRTIEGPSMAKAAGQWVMIYSGNRWDSGAYATGYAVCDGPDGPCRKPAGDNVVLSSNDSRSGPGGAEFFRTASGQLKVAYAAWDAGEVGIPNPRRLHLGTVSMTPLGLRIT